MMLNGEGAGRRAIFAASFVEDVGQMSVDGVNADMQGLRYLLIGCSPGDQPQNFDFTSSQTGGIGYFLRGRVLL